MSKKLTKDAIIAHKENDIKKLNHTFEVLLSSPNPAHWKKADLIAYWLEKYSDYLLAEDAFDYHRIPRYKRGDIILVNFGFNVGSEHGGLHYAVVLDNANKQSSPVITVIPLSSGSQEETYERDLFLGNELYEKLYAKYTSLVTQLQHELPDTISSQLPLDLNKCTDSLHKQQLLLHRYSKELAKLKGGSIALMEQITTISKMRIYKPKSSSDLLYGIRFSNETMDKINERLKDLFFFHG